MGYLGFGRLSALERLRLIAHLGLRLEGVELAVWLPDSALLGYLEEGEEWRA